MKILIPILATLPFAAYAEEGGLSGTATFTSNYISRGLTNSENKPAFQAGLIYTVSLDENYSVYGGVWGSSVRFPDESGAFLESDWSAGVIYSQGDFSLDTGAIYYKYPAIKSGYSLDYLELQSNFSYKIEPFTIRAALNYSPNNQGESGTAVYTKIALDYQADEDLKFTAHAGRQYVHDTEKFGYPDYNDWGVSATYTMSGLDWGIEYDQNNLGKDVCESSCGPKLMLTLTKNF